MAWIIADNNLLWHVVSIITFFLNKRKFFSSSLNEIYLNDSIKLSSLLDKYFDFIFSVIVTFFDASDAYTPLLSQNRTYIFCVLLLWVISSMPCTFMTISSFRGRLQMTCSHKGFSCIYFWKFIRIHLNKKKENIRICNIPKFHFRRVHWPKSSQKKIWCSYRQIL